MWLCVDLDYVSQDKITLDVERALHPMTAVAVRGRTQRHSHTGRKALWRQRQDGSDAATSQGPLGTSGASRSWKRQGKVLPQSSLREHVLLTPCLQTRSLQSCEGVHIPCGKPWCHPLWQQPKETNEAHMTFSNWNWALPVSILRIVEVTQQGGSAMSSSDPLTKSMKPCCQAHPFEANNSLIVDICYLGIKDGWSRQRKMMDSLSLPVYIWDKIYMKYEHILYTDT